MTFSARIYLKRKANGRISKSYQRGTVVSLSKTGASIVVDKMVLEGEHLFFNAQTQGDNLLYLSDLSLDIGGEIEDLTAEAIWMDSCTYENKSAFKIGIRFTEEQKELFSYVKKKNKIFPTTEIEGE